MSLVFVWPAVALTALFIVFQIAGAVQISLSDWRGFGSSNFVGISNFEELPARYGFVRALLNSVVLAVITTIGTVGVGTAIALALERKVYAWRAFRFLIFLPFFLPSTFIAILWAHGLSPYGGWANELLGTLSPTFSQAWLGDPGTVLFVIGFVAVFQSSGFPMIVIATAMADIPPEVQDAATIDGVTSWQRARHVILPMTREVILAVALLQLMWGFAIFDFVFLMTRGGPGTASETMSTFVYREAFVNQMYGIAAAAAIVMTVIVAAVTLAYLSFFRPEVIDRAG